jgi:hypothetical protein
MTAQALVAMHLQLDIKPNHLPCTTSYSISGQHLLKHVDHKSKAAQLGRQCFHSLLSVKALLNSFDRV